jgi:hypothetical protein
MSTIKLKRHIDVALENYWGCPHKIAKHAKLWNLYMSVNTIREYIMLYAMRVFLP